MGARVILTEFPNHTHLDSHQCLEHQHLQVSQVYQMEEKLQVFLAGQEVP